MSLPLGLVVFVQLDSVYYGTFIVQWQMVIRLPQKLSLALEISNLSQSMGQNGFRTTEMEKEP